MIINIEATHDNANERIRLLSQLQERRKVKNIPQYSIKKLDMKLSAGDLRQKNIAGRDHILNVSD